MTIALTPAPANLNRREVLNYFLLSSLILLTITLTGLLAIYATPRPDYLTLGPVSDYPPADRPYLIQVEQHEPPLWLVNMGSELRVFHPATPERMRMPCQYTWATITNRFEDPCSGSKFSLTGDRIDGPAPRSLDQYRVTIQRGQIRVERSRLITSQKR